MIEELASAPQVQGAYKEHERGDLRNGGRQRDGEGFGWFIIGWGLTLKGLWSLERF